MKVIGLITSLWVCVVAASAAAPDWVAQLSQHPALGQMGSNSRLLSHRITVEYPRDGRSTTIRYRMAFLSGGKTRLADFSHAVNHTGKGSLTDHGGWLMYSDGGTKKIPGGARTVSNAFEANILYSDEFISRWSLDDIPVGTIIALDFSLHADEQLDFGRLYLQSDVWETDTTVVRFVYGAPGKITYDLFQIAPDNCVTTDQEVRIGHLAKWEEVPFGGDFLVSASQLAFRFYPDGQTDTPAKTWADIANETVQRWQKVDRTLPPESYQTLLSNLPASPLDIDSITARFDREFRYVAVEVGKGRYVPHEPRQVLKYRYGDCKDLSLLLSDLLELQGMQSFPVLVLAPAGRHFDADFPSPYQFNHVIVALVRGQDTLFFDPTAKGYKAGELPWEDQGSPALWLGPSGHQFYLPRDAQAQRTRRRLCGDLDDRGDFMGTFTLSVDERIPLRTWRPTTTVQAYALVRRQLTSALSTEVLGFAVDSLPREFRADVRIRNWATVRGRDCYWKVHPFTHNLPDTVSTVPVASAYYVRRPFEMQDEVVVKLPAAVARPDSVNRELTADQGIAVFWCRTSSDSLVARWDMNFARTRYERDEKATLDSLLHSLAEHRRFTVKLSFLE